jgi:hypothetical protein
MTTQISHQPDETTPAWKHSYYAVHVRDRELGEGSEEGPYFKQVRKGQTLLEAMDLSRYSQMQIILALEISRDDYWRGIVEVMYQAQQQLEF